MKFRNVWWLWLYFSSSEMSRRVCQKCSWSFLNGHKMAVCEAGIMCVFWESGRGVRQMNETHF